MRKKSSLSTKTHFYANLVDGIDELPKLVLDQVSKSEYSHIMNKRKRDLLSRTTELIEKRKELQNVCSVRSKRKRHGCGKDRFRHMRKSASDSVACNSLQLPRLPHVEKADSKSFFTIQSEHLRPSSYDMVVKTNVSDGTHMSEPGDAFREMTSLNVVIRNLEYNFEKKKNGYDSLLKYVKHPLESAKKRKVEKVQESWLKVIFLVPRVTLKLDALKKYRQELEDERELNHAVARIQSTFRGAFVRKSEQKLQRVNMLLRKKVWIARLNVQTRRRRSHATIVRRFCAAAAATGKFAVIIKKYRAKIIFLQRFVRNFFVCQHARQEAMSRAWKTKEADLVLAQTLQDAKYQDFLKREQTELEARRAKQAREAAMSNKVGKDESKKCIGREIKFLVKETAALSNSLDQIAFRTRPGASKDVSVVQAAMLKEQKRKKSRDVKRRTSKAIRLQLLAEYLRRRRQEFISDAVLFIGKHGKNIDQVHPKVCKTDVQRIMLGHTNPKKLILEKREAVEKLRRSRTLLIYTHLSHDLPGLVRRGLQLQRKADLAKLRKQLQL